MHITIVGTGYVGLVTGACFAEFGIDVTCVDKDLDKLALLEKGQVPIYEPGLDVIITKNMREGRLHFTSDLPEAVRSSLVIFIAVGTPPLPNGGPDLAQVWEVAKAFAESTNGYKVIVNKSTVPPGTGRRMREFVGKHQREPHPFSIVSNPEFLREGSAIEDFMRPNRVVLGASDSHALAIMKDLYSPLYLIDIPFVIASIESAELIKYAANAFLAMKISFINEVANLCEIVGADVHEVAHGIGLDNRIGRKFLHPGPGYGGSCFPKDTVGFVQVAADNGYDLRIVRAVIEVNAEQRRRAIEKIRMAVGGASGKTVGILGLAFKPNTSDMRESPAIDIITALVKDGAVIRAFDPAAMEESRKILENDRILYCASEYEVAEGCDALVFATEWNQFRKLDLEKIGRLMREPVIVDLRNIYEPSTLGEMGFRYVGVGR